MTLDGRRRFRSVPSNNLTTPLAGIVKHGLLPRTTLDTRNLGYTYIDSWRLDEELGASSLSISDPYWDMLQSKRKQAPRATWAIVYFESSILWTHDCRFCFRNAAHNELSKCTRFSVHPGSCLCLA